MWAVWIYLLLDWIYVKVTMTQVLLCPSRTERLWVNCVEETNLYGTCQIWVSNIPCCVWKSRSFTGFCINFFLFKIAGKKVMIWMNPSGFCLKYMVCSAIGNDCPPLRGNQEKKQYLVIFWESQKTLANNWKGIFLCLVLKFLLECLWLLGNSTVSTDLKILAIYLYLHNNLHVF